MVHTKENEMRRWGKQRTASRDLAMLVVGIGIGSSIALLLAPYRGEDLRFGIKYVCRRVAKRVGRHTEELRDLAEDFLDHAQDVRRRGSKLVRRA
jgi:gas vesicle protein